jgi:hypothetical protein
MRSKLLALAVVVLSGACAPKPERVSIEGRTITIYNDSGEAWKGVEVWVNDHYRATRDTIEPGERSLIPLDRLATGFGQRFASNQQVTGIEVTATDADGEPVRITWGNGRRR